MTKRAILDVQLIGQTLFTPPVDANGDDLFVPDEANDMSVGPFDSTFDGSGLIEFAGRSCYQSFHKPNPKTATNRGYLAHILEVGHFSVLEHGTATFYIQGVSRSLTHELIRHRHLSPSQLSQRYVDSSEVKFVIPPIIEEWLENSAEQYAKTLRDEVTDMDDEKERKIEADRSELLDLLSERWAAKALEGPVNAYNQVVSMLERDMPEAKRKQIREAARADLPNGVETRIVLTGNYRAWTHFLTMRDSPAADAEIARLAREIGRQLAEIAPAVFDDEAMAIWKSGEQA